MFYEIKIRDHVRVPPSYFNKEIKQAILKILTEKYSNFISKNLGIIIGILEIIEVKEGIIIPGDGSAYYDTTFKILTYKPEMQEITYGKITDITDFGAFIDLGVIDGMIHISQTMDDFVSFSKNNILIGRDSKKVLKIGDKCIARIIAISFKEPDNPKIGLTMRQANLGPLHYLEKTKK